MKNPVYEGWNRNVTVAIYFEFYLSVPRDFGDIINSPQL